MARKFRLHTHRKNEFRKKRALKLMQEKQATEIQGPLISISHDVVMKGKVSTFSSLKEKIGALSILPTGMTHWM